MYKFCIYFYLIINIFTFFLFGIDKAKAKLNKWRIPENILILFCLLGGAFGGIGGMLIFNHKTRKPKFYVLVPLMFVIHSALFIYILF